MATTEWVTNDKARKITFLRSIQSASTRASRADLAVSYVVISGWELMEPLLKSIESGNVRMLVTDQFEFTQPDALRRALKAGVRVKHYDGQDGRIYHPKVYLFRGTHHNSAIVGSANLSESGLKKGVEAGVATHASVIINPMRRWFDKLFNDTKRSKDVDERFLQDLDRQWRLRAAARARVRLRGANVRRKTTPEIIEVLEDLFATDRATAELAIGTLGFDQAGNNVRNLNRALEVLARYPKINSKEKSELHLLGFVRNGALTQLGARARRCKTESGLARIWCGWVASQSDSKLQETKNERLPSFKRAAKRFWQLKPDVREFSLSHLLETKERPVLKTIELLCNGNNMVRQLTLNEIKRLAPYVTSTKSLTEFLAKRVRAYNDNKGSRSWKSGDRGIILRAWRNVTGRAATRS